MGAETSRASRVDDQRATADRDAARRALAAQRAPDPPREEPLAPHVVAQGAPRDGRFRIERRYSWYAPSRTREERAADDATVASVRDAAAPATPQRLHLGAKAARDGDGGDRGGDDADVPSPRPLVFFSAARFDFFFSTLVILS